MPTPPPHPPPRSAPALQLQPLFPLALGQVQLRPDPLDTALQLQAIRSWRGGSRSNPNPGCAWTGDLHGLGDLHRRPPFEPLLAQIALDQLLPIRQTL